MWLMLKFLLSKIFSNPIVRAVAVKTLNDFVTIGAELIPVAVDAIKDAAGRDMPNTERFDFVQKRMFAMFPGVAESVINKAIENAYDAWKTGSLSCE